MAVGTNTCPTLIYDYQASGSRRTRHRGGAARTDEASWRASWLDEYLRAGRRAQPPTQAAAGIAPCAPRWPLVWG